MAILVFNLSRTTIGCGWAFFTIALSFFLWPVVSFDLKHVVIFNLFYSLLIMLRNEILLKQQKGSLFDVAIYVNVYFDRSLGFCVMF
jgi:hypothetical protein